MVVTSKRLVGADFYFEPSLADFRRQHFAVVAFDRRLARSGPKLTAQWAGNSEQTIRKHYRRLIKPEQGKAWFAVEHYGGD